MSVVVPAYQNARYIERTIRSVLAQTYSDFELLIADHSSTDGTADIVGRFGDDRRVRLMSTEAGGGAERNWRRVTDQAQGRYLKLVCGDDLIYPGCLDAQVSALERHPSAAVAASRRDLIDVADRPLLRSRGLTGLDGLVPGPVALRALVRAGTNLLGEPGCVLLRTDAVREVGGWSARFPYLIDQYLYMRVLQHHDLVAVGGTQAAFRVSNSQWSVRLATEQARQAAQLHRLFLAEEPGVLSGRDERIGSLRALGTAWARRAAYVVWRRRMVEADGDGGDRRDHHR